MGGSVRRTPLDSGKPQAERMAGAVECFARLQTSSLREGEISLKEE
ncbi:hypothetical protein [Brevibacillus marinus]|nr:hypothetical protein [Brevibacillus marinus]